MGVALTNDQMKTLKSMVEFAEVFADQVLQIMKNSGLDKIKGCRLDIAVEPDRVFTTESVLFGYDRDDEAGKIWLTKGRMEPVNKFVPSGKNSPEYEVLFGCEEVKKALEKPLPPDGLWIGDMEWDKNDSLS